MSKKFVTMKHKHTGAVITGVAEAAIPAHEAIGYAVVVETEKPVKSEAQAADNDTAKKSRVSRE